MHLLKKLAALTLLPLFLLSCSDKITNIYHDESGMFEATIISHESILVNAYRGYFDPDYVYNYESPSNNYIKFLRISLQLKSPEMSEQINRIIIQPEWDNTIEFNNQEIKNAYQQGRLVFDIPIIHSVFAYTKYDIILYNSSSLPSNTYPIIVDQNEIFEFGWDNEWLNKDTLQIILQNRCELITDSSDVETHWLSLEKKELGISKNTIVDYKWSVSNVPSNAVYYYYIINSVIRDNYMTRRKQYISDRITIQNRP